MVQEKLEHCDTFCILRPADGKSRRKSLIHGPDYFDRNYEFQCKKTETAASDIKIPKGEEISFLERRIIKHKIRFGSLCFRAGRLRLYRNRFSLYFRTGIKKCFFEGSGTSRTSTIKYLTIGNSETPLKTHCCSVALK